MNIKQSAIKLISKNTNLGLPTFRGEPLYIPFVGAIIERIANGRKEILIQLRHKSSDSKYVDVFEIPGGKFRAYEDIYETLRREVKEECGLDITFIEGQDKRSDYVNRKDVSSVIKPFCVTQMKEGPFIGIIFLGNAKGEPTKVTNETKEARWIDINELKEIVNNAPDKIYTAFLGPLKTYLK